MCARGQRRRRPVFQAGLPAADYKGVASVRHPNVTDERQKKCRSTEGVWALFHYFTVNLTDGMGPSEAPAMRSAEASKAFCNLQKHHRLGEKATVSQTPGLEGERGANERQIKGFQAQTERRRKKTRGRENIR